MWKKTIIKIQQEYFIVPEMQKRESLIGEPNIYHWIPIELLVFIFGRTAFFSLQSNKFIAPSVDLDFQVIHNRNIYRTSHSMQYMWMIREFFVLVYFSILFNWKKKRKTNQNKQLMAFDDFYMSQQFIISHVFIDKTNTWTLFFEDEG